MAASRRRSSSGFQSESESIDELSKTFPKEEVVMEQEEEVIEVKKEPELLPEIIPTEAPPPIALKEMVKEEIAPAPQPTTSHQVPQKRHPRNIPKFSKARG